MNIHEKNIWTMSARRLAEYFEDFSSKFVEFYAKINVSRLLEFVVIVKISELFQYNFAKIRVIFDHE